MNMHKNSQQRRLTMSNDDQVVNYILSGSGCSNIFELRLAYDALRNYMFTKYNDAWDARRVAELVSKTMYDKQACNGNCNPCQCQTNTNCCKSNSEGAD